jgi:hypothetical protein
MTREARLTSGIILITVPTIQYGVYFLPTSLMNKGSGCVVNPLRQNFFRAGHAPAGVMVIFRWFAGYSWAEQCFQTLSFGWSKSECRSSRFSFLRGSSSRCWRRPPSPWSTPER